MSPGNGTCADSEGECRLLAAIQEARAPAGGRFRVEVSGRDFDGGSGPGRLITSTADSAGFGSFSGDNFEMTLEALDGCTVNDHFWVFFAAATNVA